MAENYSRNADGKECLLMKLILLSLLAVMAFAVAGCEGTHTGSFSGTGSASGAAV